MTEQARKITTDLDIFEPLKDNSKGATIIGDSTSLEIADFLEHAISDAERQRKIAMFFQQKTLEDSLLDPDSSIIEVDL